MLCNDLMVDNAFLSYFIQTFYMSIEEASEIKKVTHIDFDGALMVFNVYIKTNSKESFSLIINHIHSYVIDMLVMFKMY